MSQPRVLLLASGSGTLVQAIIDEVASANLDCELVGVICDQEQAQVIERARVAGVAVDVLEMKADRNQWNQEIFQLADRIAPDLIVSAGFMRILSAEFVERFKVINTHPALLPKYPGAHAVRDALAAGEVTTGTTVHWVDAGVDTGEIIAQQVVEIAAGDTEASLHERIKIAERLLIVEVLRELLPRVRAGR
ncbi:MAG: phosphoribosylglycinamide formyltransferase [Actinomycetes bacterium]|jgi:phosphoribosylglycinamide formyltransferase-1